MVVEKKSVSLTAESTRRLLFALQKHLKVAESAEEGAYLLIKVDEGTAVLGSHEPAEVARVLSKVLSEPTLAKHLEGLELSSELVSAFRGAIGLKEMVAAVSALRARLDANETNEQVYQRRCEEHSWAFGSAYVVRDVVRNIAAGDRIEELKRPNMPVLVWDKTHPPNTFPQTSSKSASLAFARVTDAFV